MSKEEDKNIDIEGSDQEDDKNEANKKLSKGQKKKLRDKKKKEEEAKEKQEVTTAP